MKTLAHKARDSIRLETVAGAAQDFGAFTVTPVARSLTIGRPGPRPVLPSAVMGDAFYARAWPSAVLVESGGETSRLRIADVTRWAQTAIVLVALLLLYQMVTRSKKRKERSWTTRSTS